ncbi:MAG: hypothetical protein ABIW46_04265 [Acidimicrobiales bacterium]
MSVSGRSILDLVAVLDAAREAEERTFEVVGGWVPSVAEPQVKIALSIHSRRHGDHLESLLAVTPRVAAAVAPPHGGLDPSLIDAVAALETTVGRLVALTQVLMPRLSAATGLDPGPAVAAAPAARVLGSIWAEHLDQAAEMEGLLASVAAAVVDRHGVDRELSVLSRVVRQELRVPPSNLTGELLTPPER